jgi:hypothetical protein
MIHSNLTRWIEDADAREVFLQSASMREPREVSQHQHIHLGQSIKKVFAWWHHESNGHLLFSLHGHRITRH